MQTVSVARLVRRLDEADARPRSTHGWSLPSVSQPRVNRVKVILR